MIPSRFRIIVIALAFSLAAGAALSCQTTPETDRPQLIIINSATELKLGADMYREVLSKATLSRDMRLTGVVGAVGRSIAHVTGRTDYQWEFSLIETDVPNAFCLPGGKVAVNTGILPIAENEAGLAAVIGHEVAHAIARHGAERMSHSILIAVGGEVIAQGLGRTERQRQGIRAAYGVGTAVALTLPFSRKHELEADHLGLLYMARAGYDPREAKRFWTRFAQYGEAKGDKGVDFLSTHPADEKRIAQIDRFLPEAMAEYERSRKIGAGADLL